MSWPEYRRDLLIRVERVIQPNELGWETFWKAQALRGKVAVLDDSREALGLALMRRGITNLNTEDEGLLRRASEDLIELNDLVRVKVAINGYETLPAGRMTLNQVVGRHAQRGHLLPAGGDVRRRARATVPARAGPRSTTARASAPAPPSP